MRRRFFVEKFESGSATVAGDSADHLGRVLRAEQGQMYELSDGRELWLGRIERVALGKHGSSVVDFRLVEKLDAGKSGLAPTILISLVKFDRFEWCLEKATELGAGEIVPVIAARTDKPLALAAERRQERWRKILFESARQSRRLAPPVLSAPLDSESAFTREQPSRLRILLSERPDARPMRRVFENSGPDATERARSAILAIGPEGGWTDAEFDAARAANFLEASLGENILRAETAVIAALAMLRFAATDGAGSAD